MIIRPTSEASLICRGVAILMFVVFLGVALAENQLNVLTQRHDVVRAINITRDKTGLYTFYFLGEAYTIRAVYDIARVSNNTREIIIEAAGCKIAVPKNSNFNEVKPLISMWRQQFISEAMHFKQSIVEFIAEIRLKIDQYVKLNKL